MLKTAQRCYPRLLGQLPAAFDKRRKQVDANNLQTQLVSYFNRNSTFAAAKINHVRRLGQYKLLQHLDYLFRVTTQFIQVRKQLW